MQITIKLFASLRINRFREEHRDFPKGYTIRQIIADLGIDETYIGITIVNGNHARLEDRLKDGDRLSLMPLVSGG